MTEIDQPELSPATKKEKFAELVAVVTSAAPWIGGPVAEIIGVAATNLKIKRVTEFVEGVLYLERRSTEQGMKNPD